MAFSEEIVKVSFEALLENQIVTCNCDNEYVIPENFDNALSDFLTMLYYYDLSLCVWNFYNGKYNMEKALANAVLKVAAREELLGYYCSSCSYGSCASDCKLKHAEYTSLKHFLEAKDKQGERWLATQLIEKALTVLKKTAGAYTQDPPIPTQKNARKLNGTPIDSPDLSGLTKAHIGHFFFSEYYPKSFNEYDRCDTSYFINQNKFLCELNLDLYKPEIDELVNDQQLKHESYPDNHFSFYAVCEGDGFLCGAGIPHDIGFPQSQKSETKSEYQVEFLLGVYFDPTSGLPVLPGESFKGAIRSIFEEMPEIVCGIMQEQNIKFVNEGEITIEKVEDLHKELFDFPEKSNKIIEDIDPLIRNEFLTCFPVRSYNQEGLFLGRDSITAHDDIPLKNPKASIPFLKVLPNVLFQFNLILTDGLISKTNKLLLIKSLMDIIGLGAKSRRGFGKFKFTGDVVFEKSIK